MSTFTARRWKENPNPNAAIAFVIFYPFQYYVYKNIYQELRRDAEFVIDLGAFFPNEQPSELAEHLVNFLAARGAYYRVLYHSDYYFAGYLNEFFSRYTTLVGVWERGCHQLVCNLNKKQVHLTYGAGKELTQVRFSRVLSDAILAYGKPDAELFSLLSQAVIVGNPKFDDWFNNTLDQKKIAELSQKLSPEKKTILYLPTHGDLSSLDDLSDELQRLNDTYNVIVKLHYFTRWEEPEKADRLKRSNLIIESDDTDLLPLLKCADIALSDNSSAIFDAILADKPLLTTKLLPQEYLDTEHKQPKEFRRGTMGALTYSGSIEQKLKHDGSIPTVNSASELRRGIENTLSSDSEYKKKRKKIREEIFAFNDGKCARRAAEAIRAVAKKQGATEKPLLFHAIEAYAAVTNRPSLITRRFHYRKIREYEALLHTQYLKSKKTDVTFSVIVIDEDGDVTTTLRALLQQEFPANKYEIFVVTQKKPSAVLDSLAQFAPEKNELRNVRFFNYETKAHAGEYVQKAIREACSEYVCFTKSNYLPRSHWLTEILRAYELQPDVAGVGGYAIYPQDTHILLSESLYRDIGNRLNIWKLPNYLACAYAVKNNLFHQNPVGALYNMSYKTAVLREFAFCFDATSIALSELLLKKHVMIQHDLCFFPMRVRRIDALTFRAFLRERFAEGMVWREFHRTHTVGEEYKVTLRSCLKIPLLNIMNDGYRRFSVALVLLCSSFSRLLGGTYWDVQQFGAVVSRALVNLRNVQTENRS